MKLVWGKNATYEVSQFKVLKLLPNLLSFETGQKMKEKVGVHKQYFPIKTNK